MSFNSDDPILIEEKRLVSTMITGKPQSGSFFMTVLSLLVITLVSVFYWKDPLGWSQFMPAVNRGVFTDHEWWRAFTAIFIHADVAHLLSNLYMLGIFSFLVYGYFGFKMFPVWSIVASALVNVLAVMTYPEETRLLGASGMVYLLGGVWLTMYFLIQRQHTTLRRLLRVMGISMVVFLPSTFVPNTSYRTHAIGFAVGVVLAVFYFYQNRQTIRAHEVYSVSYVEAPPTYH